MATPRGFYHYRDADGVDVIVQQLKDVPAEYRAQARLLESGKAGTTAPALPAGEKVQAKEGGGVTGREARPVPSGGRPAFSSVHWPSFMVGAGTALVAGLLLVLVFRRHSRVLSLLVGALAMLAFGVGYLTLLRQQAGLPPAGLATPATILDDARSAAAAAQKQVKQQEKSLEEINKLR